MAADTFDVRMARLEGAYDQITKRLDDLRGDIQQLRGEIRAESQQLRTEFRQLVTELHTGLRSQFWQFAALVLPLWLAAAALLFRH